MRRTGTMAAVVALALGIAGCGRGAGAPDGDILSNSLLPVPEANVQSGPAAPPGSTRDDASVTGWFGRWNGPEGTYLDIVRHPGGFPRVILRLKDDLDQPASDYIGRTARGTIRFRRRGEALTIRAGSGAETGFKCFSTRRIA